MKTPRLLTLLAATAGIAFAPSWASACSFELRHYSDQEIKQIAERAVASATTIVDGEVISPMTMGDDLLTMRPDLREGVLPVAYIKVSRVWKGHVEYDDFAPVAYFTSCDIGLDIKGQKIRILLSGTGIFTADQSNNGWQTGDQHAAFNREIDRILASPRPADFSEPGIPEPENSKQ
jgi:hypothetical protein